MGRKRYSAGSSSSSSSPSSSSSSSPSSSSSSSRRTTSSSSPSSSSSSSSSSPSSSSSSSSSTQTTVSNVQQSSNYVATSGLQKQLEKIARTQEFKNRTTDENLNIHTQKISGIDAGNTSNYFVNNKTGEVTKTPSYTNLDTYLKENGLTTLTQDSLIPKKNEEVRMASANREVFLRKEAEIKALGGTIPELNLMNKEQVSKYNEISNIITQSKPDDSQQALDDVNSSVNSFLSLDNPITQTPKSRGLSEIEETGIKDSTIISLGFTPEDVGDFQIPESKHTEEKKKFIDEKTSIGLGVIGLGVGALGLFYFLSKRKNV